MPELGAAQLHQTMWRHYVTGLGIMGEADAQRVPFAYWTDLYDVGNIPAVVARVNALLTDEARVSQATCFLAAFMQCTAPAQHGLDVAMRQAHIRTVPTLGFDQLFTALAIVRLNTFFTSLVSLAAHVAANDLTPYCRAIMTCPTYAAALRLLGEVTAKTS